MMWRNGRLLRWSLRVKCWLYDYDEICTSQVYVGGLMVGLLQCWLDGYMFIGFIILRINFTPLKQPTTIEVPSLPHSPALSPLRTVLTICRIMCSFPLPRTVIVSLP